jgi:predicted RNase H-like nuclease (RuvC/YqgF family)
MEKIELLKWLLGIATTFLFGSSGLNVWQMITLRTYKRQKSAEAYQTEIEALRKIIETNQSEIGRLAQRIEMADKRDFENTRKYNELYDKYDKLRDEFETYKLSYK